MLNANYIPPAHIGPHVGLIGVDVGSMGALGWVHRVGVGSARVVKHVGIPSALG